VKLLFINFSVPWGGGEEWHFLHSQELAKRGFEVVVLTHTHSHLRRKLQSTSIRCENMMVTNLSFLNPLKHWKVNRFLRTERPDAVLLNGSNELKLGGFSSFRLGIRKIIYRRGNGERIHPHPLNKFLFHTITHLVANSSFVLNQLRKDFKDHLPRRQYIIPNGIAIGGRHEAIRYDTCRIAVLGRLSKEKGVDLAIQAFKRITDMLPAARMVIIGEGEEHKALMKLSGKSGMDGRIEFTGFHEHPEEVLSGCSVLMIPSRLEGFCNARLEAMRLKIPVVAFGIEALKENAGSRSVIQFAKPLDPDDLADKTLNILFSPSTAKELGELGFEHVRQFYTLDKIIEKLINILEE